MNIAIIGYRGTGKSSVSKQLAAKLRMRHVSTDELIIKKAGMTVNEIVAKHGWEKFREYEKEIIDKVSNFDGAVIDCGGGIVEDNENVANLKKKSKIILLTANVETIIKRIKDSEHRPALTNDKTFTEEVKEVLSKRGEKYKSAADYIIDTSNLAVEEVVEEIVKYVRE